MADSRAKSCQDFPIEDIAWEKNYESKQNAVLYS